MLPSAASGNRRKRRRTPPRLAQRAFLQELVDAVPSSLCVVHGRDARLVLANRAAADVWGAAWQPGQPMQEFLGQHGIRIVDAQGRALPSEPGQRYARCARERPCSITRSLSSGQRETVCQCW